MSNGNAQTHQFFVAKDMRVQVAFQSSREYDVQDLKNLIAQLDMFRAMMEGESLDVSVSIQSGGQRREAKAFTDKVAQQQKAPQAKKKSDPHAIPPAPGQGTDANQVPSFLAPLGPQKPKSLTERFGFKTGKADPQSAAADIMGADPVLVVRDPAA